MDTRCPGHQEVIESAAEMRLAPPFWTIGWDVFAWMGHRRFARSWSVPQIRAELADSYGIVVSPDLIVGLPQALPGDRRGPRERAGAPGRRLSRGGGPGAHDRRTAARKGHETLYVVRELRLKR